MKKRVALYSVLHCLVDFSCLLFVTGVARRGLYLRDQWLWVLLIYNACAFALQLPLGMLADKVGKHSLWAGLGMAMVAGAWLLGGMPLPACAVAGVGNALFHLGGGMETLALSGGRAGPSGVFVSTGAFGVFLGVFFARAGWVSALLPVALMLGGLGAVIFWGRKPVPPLPETKAARPCRWNRYLLLGGLCLVFTICLRSYLGGLMGFPWKTGALALVATLAVVAGKAAGGLVGDRWGWGRTTCVSLLLSAGLFLAANQSPAAGLLAIFLFQTTMPITLTALANWMGEAHYGMAFGATTFALFLGTVPSLLSWNLPLTGMLPLATGASVVLVLLGLKLGRRAGGEVL